MSDLSSCSSSNRVTLSDERCFSSLEIDQASNNIVDNTELQNEAYCIELLHRATLHGDQDAWKTVQELLDRTVRGWIAQHPGRDEACNLDSEENYVTHAFASIYLLTVSQNITFNQFSTALQYLKVCLNGVILNKLRAFSQPLAISLPVTSDSDEPVLDHSTDNIIIWKILKESFPSVRDKRLAYLLFHCGLSPKHIVDTYPQEFNDMCEISRLRYSMFERLLQYFDHADVQ